MAQLIGLSGSLRQGSFNTSLLHAAAKLMPDGSELSVRTVHGIPLNSPGGIHFGGLGISMNTKCTLSSMPSAELRLKLIRRPCDESSRPEPG